MKLCPKCGNTKSLDDFYKDKRRPNGVRSWCKDCDLEANRQQRKQSDYREKKRKRWQRYYARPGVRAHICEKSKASRKKHHLKSKYGLTIADVVEMQKQQGNKCAICGCKFNKPHHIDHDHNTGAVRGLLCGECNLGLGKFRDSLFILKAAIQYLEKS